MNDPLILTIIILLVINLKLNINSILNMDNKEVVYMSSLSKKDIDEIQSIAGSMRAKSSISVLTGKSKCGAFNKHCTVEGCTSRKTITGNNWPRHVKNHEDKGTAKESVSFVACLGEICELCPQ